VKSSDLGEQFMAATLRNAHSLLADAQLLFGNERWARAQALATLSTEEIGKAWLAWQAMLAYPDAPIKPARQHAEKITAAREYLAFASGFLAGRVDVDEWFSEGHAYAADHDFFTRMAYLYVDVVDDEVVGGSTEATQGDAERALDVADAAVHLALRGLWPHEDERVPVDPEAG
jgi:AbiV family abortive infection protein